MSKIKSFSLAVVAALTAAIAYFAPINNITTSILNLTNMSGWFAAAAKKEIPKINVFARSKMWLPAKQFLYDINNNQVPSNGPLNYRFWTAFTVTISVENINRITLERVVLRSGYNIVSNNLDGVGLKILTPNETMSFDVFRANDYGPVVTSMFDLYMAKNKQDISALLTSLNSDVYMDANGNQYDDYTACYKNFDTAQKSFFMKYFNHRLVVFDLQFSDKLFNRSCVAGNLPFKFEDMESVKVDQIN